MLVIIFLASEEDFATFMALADDSYDAKSGEYIFIYVRSTAELTMVTVK